MKRALSLMAISPCSQATGLRICVGQFESRFWCRYLVIRELSGLF